jgi:hypothetical protein
MGVRLSPGVPPMVPLIPEIDFISVIAYCFRKNRFFLGMLMVKDPKTRECGEKIPA